ncbi:MAG: DNA repair protein RecO [Coriobacteriales bacterium]|jgi:DNA repair protein RecO (recombination protein O)
MPSYKANAIVLKKTKLGEQDLILTLLSEDGFKIRCVAKGARKPGSTFSARLEVFSVVDLLLYKGKNLDTITEVKVLDSNVDCRRDVERLSYGAVIAELVEDTALEGQETPILFPLTRAGLSSLGRASDEALPFVTSAYLMKAIAYLGYKPSFGECTVCGKPNPLDGSGKFSLSAGGWVCGECLEFAGDDPMDFVDSTTASWVNALLGMKFEQIEDMFGGGQSAGEASGTGDGQSAGVASGVDSGQGTGEASTVDAGQDDSDGQSADNVGASEEEARNENYNALAGQLLDFCEKWVAVHLGLKLKSLSYLSHIHA